MNKEEHTIEDLHAEIEFLKLKVDYVSDALNILEKWHTRLINITFAFAAITFVLLLFTLS